MRCCGSGSGIRCCFDPLDTGWKKFESGIRDKHCRSTTLNPNTVHNDTSPVWQNEYRYQNTQNLAVVWIRDVYPGYWFIPIPDPGLRISDPGSQKATKERSEKKLVPVPGSATLLVRQGSQLATYQCARCRSSAWSGPTSSCAAEHWRLEGVFSGSCCGRWWGPAPRSSSWWASPRGAWRRTSPSWPSTPPVEQK